MNHLAHAYLSGADPAVQVGGIAADFLKGPIRKGRLPDAVARGVRLHRLIDAATDADPGVGAARRLLPPPWRRFAGILLDVYFDHLLAKRWAAFHGQPLARFCASCYAAMAELGPPAPTAQPFWERAPRARWLERIGEEDFPQAVLDHLGARLRRPVALGRAWPELVAREAELSAVFLALMDRHRQLATGFLGESP